MRPSYVFDASWPILKPQSPLSDLVDEALDLFADMAQTKRVQLLADPTWSIAGGRLRVQAPAAKVRRVPAGATRRPLKVQSHIDDIRRWAVEDHLTDEAITRRLRDLYGVTCDRTAIYKARARSGIPAGRGNPTLGGYTPQNLAAPGAEEVAA